MLEQDKINALETLFEIFPICHKWFLRSTEPDRKGISKTQELILFSLMNKPTFTMSKLAHSIHSSKEHATRSVNSLVELELLERINDKTNRRLVIVKLTEKGQKFILERKQNITQKLIEQFNSLSEEDMTSFKNAVLDLHRILLKLDSPC